MRNRRLRIYTDFIILRLILSANSQTRKRWRHRFDWSRFSTANIYGAKCPGCWKILVIGGTSIMCLERAINITFRTMVCSKCKHLSGFEPAPFQSPKTRSRKKTTDIMGWVEKKWEVRKMVRSKCYHLSDVEDRILQQISRLGALAFWISGNLPLIQTRPFKFRAICPWSKLGVFQSTHTPSKFSAGKLWSSIFEAIPVGIGPPNACVGNR